MKKVNIFFIQPHPTYGAIEFYLSTIANSLLSKGDYKITVMTPDRPGSDNLIRSLNTGISVMRIPKFAKAPPEINWYKKYFLEYKPDISHFNDPALNAMIAARLSKVKKRVITYHTPTLPISFNLWGNIAWKLSFDKALNIITTNEDLKHIAIKKLKLPAGNFTSIHYGLDPARFIVEKKDDNLKKELQIENSHFVIGTVARLEQQKRHDVLLKSISMLKGDIKKRLKVLIVGEGSLAVSLKALTKSMHLEHMVIFTGYKTDIERYLSIMDLFVLTSDFEGACMAVIEAMAMSQAIISTDIPGVRDTLGYGLAGRLVPRGNPAALAKAIDSLVDNKKDLQSLGHAARKSFLERFTLKKMVCDSDVFYKGLMNLR